MASSNKLPDEVLDLPVEVGESLRGAATFREALGPRATVVQFVRHFG